MKASFSEGKILKGDNVKVKDSELYFLNLGLDVSVMLQTVTYMSHDHISHKKTIIIQDL